MVKIDGSRVRNLRESKGLTQLYIATVVGVTTDTISRWENNRYPTIRRENALKLAEALEVPLDDILLKPAGETSGADTSLRKTSPILWLLLALLILAAVLIACLTKMIPLHSILPITSNNSTGRQTASSTVETPAREPRWPRRRVRQVARVVP